MIPKPVYTSGEKVYTFNGTSDFATVDNSDAINFGTNEDFTVAVWIQAESQQKYTGNADNDVVEKWSHDGGYPYVIRYSNQKTGNNSGKIWVRRYDGKNNPGVNGSTKINDGKFHHVAFVRRTENNEGTLFLYVDGKLEGSSKDTTTGNTKNNSPVYLGRRGVSGVCVNWFTGSIKGLSIYNVGFSAEQIQEVINPIDPLMKQGPVGSSVAGTDFDIQPKTDALGSRIKRVLLRSGWAINKIQVEYENLATNPSTTYLSGAYGSDGGNPDEFVLNSNDYITEVISSWGRQASGYPKEEIISLQFKTHQGVTSKVWGGVNGSKEVEPFSFKAPEGYQIIGFFGAYGSHQNCLVRLGVYLKPVSEPQAKVKTYLIKSKLNGLVLDVAGASKAPGTCVITWDVNHGDSQKWTMTPEGLIKSELNGFVLDYQDIGYPPYYLVVVNPVQGTNGSASQQWKLEDGVMKNKQNPNLVLDIAGAQQEKAAGILAAPYNGGLHQNWELVKV
jgi:hypothetical protein